MGMRRMCEESGRVPAFTQDTAPASTKDGRVQTYMCLAAVDWVWRQEGMEASSPPCAVVAPASPLQRARATLLGAGAAVCAKVHSRLR